MAVARRTTACGPSGAMGGNDTFTSPLFLFYLKFFFLITFPISRFEAFYHRLRQLRSGHPVKTPHLIPSSQESLMSQSLFHLQHSKFSLNYPHRRTLKTFHHERRPQTKCETNVLSRN